LVQNAVSNPIYSNIQITHGNKEIDVNLGMMKISKGDWHE
jgi:hypothetical protein